MSDAEPIIRPNFAGTPSVRGTRLTVYNIMDHYLANDPVEWVAGEVFFIPVGDVEAAYAYIREHEAELMPRYRELVDPSRRVNPPEVEAKLEESHQRFLAKLDPVRRAEVEALFKEALGDARVAG